MRQHQSIRIFKSDFWERFTHVHPITPLVMWTPVIATLIYRGFAVHEISVGTFVLAAFLGVFLWTLVEYLLHRFAFHYDAKNAFGKRVVYIMHGLHHDDANDPTRLVMPPVPALIYGAVLFLLFRAITGPVFVEPFFAFFLVGYLSYDYIHYYVHHFVPKNPIGKYLKKYHMLHHYAAHGAKWGVSSPLWDYVFRTVEEHVPPGQSPSKRPPEASHA